MAYCSNCGAGLGASARFCPSCGHTVGSGTGAASGGGAQVDPGAFYGGSSGSAYGNPTVYTSGPVERVPTQGEAIIALILNLLIWPGLGSLVASRSEGWAQGFMMLGGIVLTVTIIGAIIGIPLIIAAYIWGIVTGVQLLGQAK